MQSQRQLRKSPQSTHHTYINITADDKGISMVFSLFFFLPCCRWCCPPVVNDWKRGVRVREGEREKCWMRGERGNRVSALRALGWQTGSRVYYAYEWGGGDSSPCVSLSGQSKAAAPYLEVDVSLCFFWQRCWTAQLAKQWEVKGQGEWSVF